MLDIIIEKTTAPKDKPADESKLGFGKIFTDHMFLAKYKEGKGWYEASIQPYGPIALDPSLMTLHYAQSIFEGLKAYRGEDGKIRLFRPEKNFARLNESAERMCLPQVDEEFALRALKTLVDLDRDWVPSAPGTSLYLRPFMFGVDQYVGVHPSSEAYFMIICSPVGAYYPTGLDPVKIIVEQKYVRAVKGGTGYIKAAANYAQSLKAQQEAEEKNYSQVLWLDGVEHKYIEEVGTMNIFFVFEDEIVTPALNGSILSGITRMSCIEMLKDWGLPIVERQLSIDEVMQAAESGCLKECFGSGTAAVISPVGELMVGDKPIVINGGKIGEISQRLYDNLTGVQWGKVEDKLNWTITI